MGRRQQRYNLPMVKEKVRVTGVATDRHEDRVCPGKITQHQMEDRCGGSTAASERERERERERGLKSS